MILCERKVIKISLNYVIAQGWRIYSPFGQNCKDVLLALQAKRKLLLMVLMGRHGGEKAFAKSVATYQILGGALVYLGNHVWYHRCD